MSCRSTPATSAATTFARLNSELNDVQTLSAFHMLRASASPAATPSEEQWQHYLAEERGLIGWHPNLTEARRASLLRRIDSAMTGQVPDGRTFAAMRQLRRTTSAQSRALTDRYHDLAERYNVSFSEIRNRATALMATVNTQRGAPAPVGYTAVAVNMYRDSSLPVDRQTVHALSQLEQSAPARFEITTTPRVQRVAVTSAAIREVGYNADGGRLEVVFNSNPERVYAYRNVDEAVFTEMTTGSAGRAWHRHIRTNDNVRYTDEDAATADATQRRCMSCGQFSGTSHTCAPVAPGEPPTAEQPTAEQPTAEQPTAEQPTAVSDTPRQEQPRPVDRSLESWRSDPDLPAIGVFSDTRTGLDRLSNVRVTQPSYSALVSATWSAPTGMSIEHFGSRSELHHGSHPYRMQGVVTFARTENGGLDVSMRHVRCTCPAYLANGNCPHLEAHSLAMIRRLDPNRAARLDIINAQAEVEKALAEDWTQSKHHAMQARLRYATGADNLYSDNAAMFLSDSLAEQDTAIGEALPYMSDDATGGMLTRDSGRGFGVEIEFDLPNAGGEDEEAEILSFIAADLHSAGLTAVSYQQPYHSGEGEYSDNHQGGWKFEEDGTVAGEVISPIMYDEPETWENLRLVCEIVKYHGGRATVSTGGHVHVGTSAYNHTSENHTELVRLVNQNEDVLYRLAQNPHDPDGEHRPLNWCAPNTEVPLAGYRDITQASISHMDHSHALNLEGVNGDGSDHVEFRHWDGSLDASVIQAQVKISAALVVAAHRIADEHGSAPRPREPIGSHRTRRGTNRSPLTVTEQDNDSASTRSLLDTLFSRNADKAQIAALFGRTQWQRRTPRRGVAD